jgi:hypothetical protein
MSLFSTEMVQFKSRLLWRGTDIAKYLGVRPQNVDMWRQRRTGGFPEPVAYSLSVKGGGKRRAPLWDAGEVMTWWLEYDPSARRGGKRGNRGNRSPRRKSA